MPGPAGSDVLAFELDIQLANSEETLSFRGACDYYSTVSLFSLELKSGA